MRLIVHDFETTSVDARTCGVCQSAIAIVDIDIYGEWEIIAQEVELHHPGVSIPQGAAKVHGITDKMVANKANFEESLPATYEQAISEFAPTGVLGYNSNTYDNTIARRLGLDVDALVQVDMMIAARRLMNLGHIPRARLVDAYEGLTGKKAENAHDAMADVVMTLELIKPTMKIMGLESFPCLIGWLEKPQVDKRTLMPFGKHKGSPLDIIPKDYLEWLMKKGDLDYDLAESVKAALNGN